MRPRARRNHFIRPRATFRAEAPLVALPRSSRFRGGVAGEYLANPDRKGGPESICRKSNGIVRRPGTVIGHVAAWPPDSEHPPVTIGVRLLHRHRSDSRAKGWSQHSCGNRQLGQSVRDSDTLGKVRRNSRCYGLTPRRGAVSFQQTGRGNRTEWATVRRLAAGFFLHFWSCHPTSF